jgi:hypothetical protein
VKKITNKKELPSNAKILHPDKKWRDKKGRLTKRPIDEPTYKYDGRHYTEFKRKPKKKKKPKPPPIPEVITQPTRQRLYRPVTLAQVLDKRNLRFSEDISRGMQKAMADDVERRLNVYHDELKEMGANRGIDLDVDVKISEGGPQDLTVNAEIVVYLHPGISIREILETFSLKIYGDKALERMVPPTAYASIGYRYATINDRLRENYFPVISADGEIVERKRSIRDVYQAQTGYVISERGMTSIWKLAEEFLESMYDLQGPENPPTEVFVRIHWNPYVDENGKPFVPTRQK